VSIRNSKSVEQAILNMPAVDRVTFEDALTTSCSTFLIRSFCSAADSRELISSEPDEPTTDGRDALRPGRASSVRSRVRGKEAELEESTESETFRYGGGGGSYGRVELAEDVFVREAWSIASARDAMASLDVFVRDMLVGPETLREFVAGGRVSEAWSMASALAAMASFEVSVRDTVAGPETLRDAVDRETLPEPRDPRSQVSCDVDGADDFCLWDDAEEVEDAAARVMEARSI
jgi:hypothetical protein